MRSEIKETLSIFVIVIVITLLLGIAINLKNINEKLESYNYIEARVKEEAIKDHIYILYLEKDNY